ncbi:hypothetical protein sos41_36810 [Alphaproteobacteria bacterium SO-S41]|nr:hypothetical protein sos41_36810 [Alphaproteobacteria bacterium SO-S41]
MVNLLSGVYWFDDALQDALRRHGWDIVTRAQSLLFANLATGEESPSRLAKNLGVTRQAISQLLAEVEARGLVVIDTDPADRRARIVRFSEKSLPLRDAARSVLAKLEAELEKRLGRKVFAALQAGLQSEWGALPEVEPDPVPKRTAKRPVQRPKALDHEKTGRRAGP